MSTADIKLSLMERLLFVENKKLLQRMLELLDADGADWEPTGADLKELDHRRAKRISGESKGLSRAASVKRLRARKAA